MNFYEAINCNRSFNVQTADKQTLNINFHPYEHVGTWLGVFATEKPDEIEALDLATKNPKSGIAAITEKQYLNAIKKKTAASNGYTQSLANSTPTPGVPDAPSVVGNPIETNLPGEQISQPLDSVEDALTVVPRTAK